VRDNGAVLAPSVPLLSEALRARGYATAAFVSGFPLERRFGFDRGFDHFDDRLTDGFTTADGHVRGTERTAEKTVDAFLRWFPGAKRPYFVWVHLFDPHAAYSAPRPFRRMYYSGSERNPENRSLEGIEIPPYLMLVGVTDVRFPIALYEGEVTYTDHEVGRLLAGLEERGAARRTLVAVVGDHGESMTEHGYYFGHSSFLYEPSTSVPFLLRWPGRVPEGRIVTAPVCLVDLAPTLLGLLGVSTETPADGRSLVPLLGTGSVGDEAMYLERPPLPTGGLFGVREGPWKYVRRDDGAEELYRLDEDPRESRNRAVSDPEEAARLRSLLENRRREAGTQQAPILDEETREKLRALGYAG
jgi:arylsulfatase A-like enzyme